MSIDLNNKRERVVSESKSFDDGEGEDLDPRVKTELEQLNAATDGINHLETELNEAQVLFNQMMQDATTQLKSMHQKLGKCVDKARPYYEALKNAKNARIQLHEASLAYEVAQTKHFNAKKRVVDAERKANESIDGRLDPTLQELLNQVTTEVMDTAIAFEEAGKKYSTINEDFNKKHVNLQKVYNRLKTQVGKSRPFFELKSNLNKKLEVQKQRLQKIQEGIQLSKQAYSETLRKLQIISDDIHKTRHLKRQSLLSGVSEGSSDDSQHTNMIRNISLDDTSDIFIDDDTRSIDSEVYDDNTIWRPGLIVEDTQSTTSSRDIEYNLLQMNASMENSNISKKNEESKEMKKLPILVENNSKVFKETCQSKEHYKQTNQSKGRKELSGIVIKVDEAMKGMQDGLTSPFVCVTSHSLQYSTPSSFSEDVIDGKKGDSTINNGKSQSFTDLLKLSLSSFSMGNLVESRNRCNSLPNMLDMEFYNID